MEDEDKQQPALNKKELNKLLQGVVRNHTDLVKWLYDNHRSILREYEKTKGNLNIHFLEDRDGKSS